MKKNKILKRIFLSVFAVMFLLGSVSLVYLHTKQDKRDLDQEDTELVVDRGTQSSIDDEILLHDLKIQGESSPITFPEGDAFHSEDVLNILLIGTDERTKEFSTNARADSMMLLSLNRKEHTAKLVSLERGIGVPVPGRNDDWLTHVFRYGGADLLMKTIRDCFKVDVERYIRVNFYTLSQIINSIGGVDIPLTEAEADYLNNNKLYFAGDGQFIHHVEQGMNHLDGDTALAYARIRAIDSDWNRIKRQRTVLQSAINQTKGLTLAEIDAGLIEVLLLIRTNFTKQEIISLLFEAPAFRGIHLEQLTIPVEGTYWGIVGVDGRRMYGVDFEENAKILKNFFYGTELYEGGI